LETEKWKIRYVIVDTKNWLPGGKDVLVSPAWIEKITWSNNLIYFDLQKETLKNSPAYNSEEPLDGEFELELFKYYGYQRSKNK
jgi:hypothetical protein